MRKVTVDGVQSAGATVLQTCELAGKEIPCFRYLERLSIGGSAGGGGVVTIKRSPQLLLVGMLAASACPAVAQDGEPERESITGSLIPRAVDYGQMAADRARRSTSRFASCVYKRDPEQVIKLLDNGDSTDINWAGAGLTESNFQGKLGLEWCLSQEAVADRIQMKLQPGDLHSMLTEPAYLAANRVPPTWLAAPFPAGTRHFVAQGEGLNHAEGLAALADCMAKAAPAQADALLRTEIASDEERRAAVALAPVLSRCFFEGQSLTVTPANIRGWAASGMWQAERSRTRLSAEAN